MGWQLARVLVTCDALRAAASTASILQPQHRRDAPQLDRAWPESACMLCAAAVAGALGALAGGAALRGQGGVRRGVRSASSAHLGAGGQGAAAVGAAGGAGGALPVWRPVRGDRLRQPQRHERQRYSQVRHSRYLETECSWKQEETLVAPVN